MELWIRTQDRERFTRCSDLRVYYAKQDDVWVIEDCDDLGSYKTKERALEILDEIQDKFKNKYLAKVNPIVNHNDFDKLIKAYEEFNKIELIGSNELVDITPINQEVLVYEMPKE